MVLREFYSLGIVDEHGVSKTQPCYKEADIGGERILETGLNGQKSNKNNDNPKTYWKTGKPKSAPQINIDYSKKGVEVGPSTVSKAIIKPEKPTIPKGSSKIGRKPFDVDLDLSHTDANYNNVLTPLLLAKLIPEVTGITQHVRRYGQYPETYTGNYADDLRKLTRIMRERL